MVARDQLPPCPGPAVDPRTTSDADFTFSTGKLNLLHLDSEHLGSKEVQGAPLDTPSVQGDDASVTAGVSSRGETRETRTTRADPSSLRRRTQRFMRRPAHGARRARRPCAGQRRLRRRLRRAYQWLSWNRNEAHDASCGIPARLPQHEWTPRRPNELVSTQ